MLLDFCDRIGTYLSNVARERSTINLFSITYVLLSTISTSFALNCIHPKRPRLIRCRRKSEDEDGKFKFELASFNVNAREDEDEDGEQGGSVL
jgi:hypothetical protein